VSRVVSVENSEIVLPMPEPFKNNFSTGVILDMARHFQNQWPDFDADGFYDAASNDLNLLELKQRSNQILDAMIVYLPDEFEQAGNIILATLGQPQHAETISEGQDVITGWAIMPIADYVGQLGLEHFDLSMSLFKEMTKQFSAEFGIRYFLLKSPQKTLAALKTWTSDDDYHVRRLVSEGTRPRLPWGMRLPCFIEDPLLLMPLLEALKDDAEEYVRRSVANNLNDIAKDNPELVVSIAEDWMKNASKERKKLIRHACRTLIKDGHEKVLSIFGYATPEIKQASVEVHTPELIFGNALEFTLSINSNSDNDQALMIDYIIHHRKANGTTSPKVFKWRDIKLRANKVLISNKKHLIRKITTRVYYPGVHTLEIMVNGVSAGKADFNLLIPEGH
jgi:3-methyladenine DNA glycosylase AlkC